MATFNASFFLRAHIRERLLLRRAEHKTNKRLLPLDAARGAHVGELHVAVVREQHVVRLQVAVEDVELVQVLRGEHDLRRVEARALVRVRPAHQVRVHVAALDVVEHEAQMVLRL